jgi:hypothetical protein
MLSGCDVAAVLVGGLAGVMDGVTAWLVYFLLSNGAPFLS